MSRTARVAVVGATGYAGYELARLLLRHPFIETPTFYLREGNTARCLTEIFPHLRGWGEAPCKGYSVEAISKSGAQVAFLCTPVEASLEMVPALAEAGVRVVDLSGGFRFRNPEVFSRWYNVPAAPQEWLDQAVYGLPELDGKREQLRDARIVGNPGCYPTSVILGLRPLVESGWLDAKRGIVCDCKSGVTGAGKEPKRETHFVEVNENFHAYNVFKHRHTPEVIENTGLDLNDVIFTTQLLPVERGILSTLSVWLAEPHTSADIEALYRKRYAGWPMVRIWPAGKLPELQHVTHTNFCDIGFVLAPDGRRLVVVSCLDNLGKGAAGQAVQNMNEMLTNELSSNAGFSPEAGLL